MEGKMKRFHSGLLVLLMVFCITAGAWAGTRDDVIIKCKEAAAYIKEKGIDTAIVEINKPGGAFVWKDGVNYVFLMNMKSKMLAHPFSKGLLTMKPDRLLKLKDSEGTLIIAPFIDSAKRGRGWSKYKWPIPGQTKETQKYTYIYRVPDTDYLVGAGFYVVAPGEYY